MYMCIHAQTHAHTHVFNRLYQYIIQVRKLFMQLAVSALFHCICFFFMHNLCVSTFHKLIVAAALIKTIYIELVCACHIDITIASTNNL